MKRKPKSLPAVAPRNQVVIALSKRQAGGGVHGKTAKAQRRLDKMDMHKESLSSLDARDTLLISIKVSSCEGASIEGEMRNGDAAGW